MVGHLWLRRDAAAVVELFSPGIAGCAARIVIMCALILAACGVARAETTPEPVTVGVYVSPPFVEEHNGRYTGMAVDLWEKVAANTGIHFNYKPYASFRDLVDAASAGEVDVALTNLSITRARMERMAFTQPWFDSGLRIMVENNEDLVLGDIWSGLGDAGHLRAYVWLACVMMMATLALALFDRKFDPNFPRRWREALAESFYHVVSIAVSGKTTRKNLFGWIGRIWQGIWVMSGVAVIAYVTSSVTSVMTALAIDGSVNSLADLSGKTVGVFTGSVAEDYVTGLGIASRSYANIDAAAAALEQGYVAAVVADAPTLEHFVHKHPQYRFSVVGHLFHPDKYGFAFPLDSSLTKPVTLEILDLQEGGDIAELRLRYFGHAP